MQELIIYDTLNDIDLTDKLAIEPQKPVILFAALETWNTDEYCLKDVTNEGRTLKDIIVKSLLRSCYSQLRVTFNPDYGYRVDETHHDGTNTYYYRYMNNRYSFRRMRRNFFASEKIDDFFEEYKFKTKTIKI